MDRRIVSVGLELRAVCTENEMSVRGYAATYGTLSHPLPAGNGQLFRERIAHRAFDGILATNPDVIATFNHNQDSLLGRTTAGTLKLRGDDKGLAFSIDLPNTTVGRDVHTLVKRGDIKGCSFAFELGQRGDDEWSEEDIDDEIDLGLGDDDQLDDEEKKHRSSTSRRSKCVVRTIRNFSRLHDIALVTTPAYPGTRVRELELVGAEVRSAVNQLLGLESEEETYLRHAAKVAVKLAERATDETVRASRRRSLL